MMEKYMIGVHTKLWSGPVGSSQGELDAFMTLKPAADEAERERVGHKNYMSIVGSLLYAACMTRPDIAFTVPCWVSTCRIHQWPAWTQHVEFSLTLGERCPIA